MFTKSELAVCGRLGEKVGRAPVRDALQNRLRVILR